MTALAEQILASGITVPSEEGVSHSASIRRDREKCLVPVPVSDFYIWGNGIDVRHRFAPPYAKPFDYEDACFARIATDRENQEYQRFIGPHLLDIALEAAFYGRVRPDAMKFDVLDSSLWRLTGLFEFKSTMTEAQATRKIQGFSTLLSLMRERGDALPRKLKQALPAHEEFPEKIMIPDNREIKVTFMSPQLGYEVVFLEDVPPFQEVSHLFVAA